jgi:dihydroneopterin aldolase
VRISLVGMRFHVRVGTLPHERELAQPLVIDLTVSRADDRPDILDYRALYALAAAEVAREPLEHLETLAESIAAGALALDGVLDTRVAVRKPHVPLGGPLDYAEIVVERAHG